MPAAARGGRPRGRPPRAALGSRDPLGLRGSGGRALQRVQAGARGDPAADSRAASRRARGCRRARAARRAGHPAAASRIPPHPERPPARSARRRDARLRCAGLMDPDRFLRGLRDRFDDFPRSELPLDLRFAEILDAVQGLARANNLALLNAAVNCLDPDESYVEVGTYHGTSLIAAMLDNDARFVAIDNWSLGDGGRERLERNLAR